MMKVNLSLIRIYPQHLLPVHRVRRGKGGGGGGGGSSKDSSSNSESGSDSSQSDDLYRKEKRLMRAKAYETFKIPALPKNAAEAREFRNQLHGNITKPAKGDEAPVFRAFPWISNPCRRKPRKRVASQKLGYSCGKFLQSTNSIVTEAPF